MSLENILLGMLREPASGYDLKEAFERGPRNFWAAELSQIYPALRKLDKDGFLESKVEPSTKGPPRRVYKRTAAGRKRLLEWLGSGPELGAERFAYLAQLAFMHEFSDLEQTRDFILELRSKLAGFLGFLKEAQEGLLGEGTDSLASLSDVDFHDYLCVRMGIHSLAAKVAWCDECLQNIQERQRPQVVKTSQTKHKERKAVNHG